MGIIRKTASIGTLGIVSFRSKKELLRRAEKGKRAAEAELEQEQAARAEADHRVMAAEKRVHKAELAALHEAQVAAKAKNKAKGRRGRRKRGRDRGARNMLSDLVSAAQPVVEEQAKEVGRRARKAAKASRKASRKAAGVATETAQGIKEDLVDLTSTAADKIKDRADSVRNNR